VEPDEQALSAACAQEMRSVLMERARRQVEALKLYEPLSVQAAFHQSKALERIVRGSNQSGKTLSAAVEFARAVTKQDPFQKYRTIDTAIVVGKDGKHLGHTIWEKLFKPGAFQIIRDEVTGKWRSFRPWVAEDVVRAGEASDAPPLIPERLVKWNEIAWESKRENIPSVVPLLTGCKILFFSSLGKPPQGMLAGYGWFDEEIVDQQWYPEISARLLRKGGCFVWSATPQAGTEQLYALHERAEQQEFANRQPRTVDEFVLLLDSNPHVSDANKQALAEKYTDEERAVRIGGEFALLSYRVFPEYSMATHGVDYLQIPNNWTRYASVDPGRQVCAVLFLAVPPPEENAGNHVYLYDELYIQNADAEQFGQAMKRKAMGQEFHAFIIDNHAGRQTEIGSGRTIEEQYTDALRRHKVKSRTTGHGFVWGASNVQAGIEAARDWMRIRPDGTTKLRVLRHTLSSFDYEVKRYRYKRVAGLTTDEPETRGAVHQMANLRYLASHQPRFMKAKPGQVAKSGAVAAFQRKKYLRKKMHGEEQGYVRLGPGGKR